MDARMNRNMAHHHEALLNEPCAHCAAEPLAKLPDGYPADASEWLVALAGAIVLAMVFGAFVWWLVVMFG